MAPQGNPNCLNGIEARVFGSSARTILEEIANRLVLARTKPDEIPVILALCKAVWKKDPDGFEENYNIDHLLEEAFFDATDLLAGEKTDEELSDELTEFCAGMIGGVYLVEMFESFAASEK